MLVAEELSAGFALDSRLGAWQSTAPACVRLAPNAGDIADYLHDESKLASAGVSSLAVPHSLAELRDVMSWHAAEHHMVAVSGTRTGVAGGAVPEAGAHLVSMAELRGVLRVDANGEVPTASVLGGTWLSELTGYLATHHEGLVFPVDPTETSASFGGMVSTNAGGARSYRFGSMRPWVQGLTVELASGRTLHLTRGVQRAAGGRLDLRDGADERRLEIGAIPKPSTKNAIGPGFELDGDALDLFVGAEGTLGVVSEVTVRLFRTLESRMGFLQFFDSVPQAFAFVNALRAAPTLRTTAMEFLDARSHDLARESGRASVDRVLQGAPSNSCSVFVEIAYDGDDELATIVDRLEDMVAGAGGDTRTSLAGASEGELKDIRAFRHAVPERVNAIIAQRREQHPGLHKIATDMSVRDADLSWIFGLYQERLTAAGLDFAVFGHVGNNHFHVNILPRDEGELERAKGIYAGFARDVVERGGAVSAEHGIGRIKSRFLAVQFDASTMQALRAVKRWADPEWRLNRGVLIEPEAEDEKTGRREDGKTRGREVGGPVGGGRGS